MKCKVEKRYFLDPEQVSARMDELVGLLRHEKEVSLEIALYLVGYIKAHIERDEEERLVAVSDEE